MFLDQVRPRRRGMNAFRVHPGKNLVDPAFRNSDGKEMLASEFICSDDNICPAINHVSNERLKSPLVGLRNLVPVTVDQKGHSGEAADCITAKPLGEQVPRVEPIWPGYLTVSHGAGNNRQHVRQLPVAPVRQGLAMTKDV